MSKEYKIKGIEKILEKVSKEDLAKYYGVDIDSNFEEIITKSFEENGIPNNSEIALYVALTPEEYNKMREERKSTRPTDIASEYYKQDERQRTLIGLDYNICKPQYDDNMNFISGTKENVIYLAFDEPIKESDIENINMHVNSYVGGYQYHGLIMGNKYFEEHEKELEESSKGKKDEIKAIVQYIENFFNEFKDVEHYGGYGPKSSYEETDKIKQEKARNEKLILQLTGKNSIDELSLKDFINLKRNLEKEEKELQKQFEEKFISRENNVRE